MGRRVRVGELREISGEREGKSSGLRRSVELEGEKSQCIEASTGKGTEEEEEEEGRAS